MKVKRELNALDLMCILEELKTSFVGDLFFVNVYQISSNHFLFKLRVGGEGALNLIFEIGRRFHLTNLEYEKPSKITSFCRFIRKNFNRSRVVEFSQYDFDRVVELKVHSRSVGEASLIIELVREGNLIVVDSSRRILSVFKPLKMKDRELLPNNFYVYPPLRGLNPLSCTPQRVREKFSNAKVSVVRALTRLMNLPGEIAEEICLRANVKESLKACRLDLSDIDEMLRVFNQMISEVKDLNLNPQIVYCKGKILSVTPFDFKIYDGFEKEYFESFNEAVDIYFHKLLLLEEEELKSRVRLEVESRFKAVMDKQYKRLEELRIKSSKYRRWAETIMDNLNLVQDAIRHINELRRKGFSWGEISRNLKELIDAKFTGLFESFDARDRILNVRLKGEVIPVKVDLSATANASQFFDKAKKFSRRAANALNAIEEMRLKIQREVEASLRARVVKPIRVIGVVRRRKWYENFRWFISSNGFLVVGGRDASQNESLVRRRLGENDIFVHAEIHGAPAVIIKSGGRDVPSETLFEAAQFAVSYSRAWTAGFEVASAFWVYGNQVSKSPPSGEYLARGAFMVYGNRNYLKNIPLRICVGIEFLNGSLRLVVGPPSAIKRMTEYHVTLAPGDIPRDVAVRKIRDTLASLVDEPIRRSIRRIPLSNFLELLPKGSFRFL